VVLGERELVDLVVITGIYSTVAMILCLNSGGWPSNVKVLKPFSERKKE
jgi:hypothetical protein